MKARIKETGQVVEINDLYDDGTALVQDTYFKISELDFFDDFENIDWERRRYELIKDFFLKWTGIDDIKRKVIVDEHIRICIETADALIEKLKKEVQNE